MRTRERSGEQRIDVRSRDEPTTHAVVPGSLSPACLLSSICAKMPIASRSATTLVIGMQNAGSTNTVTAAKAAAHDNDPRCELMAMASKPSSQHSTIAPAATCRG